MIPAVTALLLRSSGTMKLLFAPYYEQCPAHERAIGIFVSGFCGAISNLLQTLLLVILALGSCLI